jgi:hypothetical protein
VDVARRSDVDAQEDTAGAQAVSDALQHPAWLGLIVDGIEHGGLRQRTSPSSAAHA